MFVSCTSLQKVYENLSKIVVLTAFVSLASAKLRQEIILAKYFKGKFQEKLIFAGISGKCRARMIVKGCKSGGCNMDFGKTGGMSTATLSQRRERRGQILYSLYIIGRQVIFENKYLLTLAHLYIVINYANYSMSATLL